MAASNKTSLAAAQLPGGSETILVADDDDTVFNSGALMAVGRHKGHFISWSRT